MQDLLKESLLLCWKQGHGSRGAKESPPVSMAGQEGTQILSCPGPGSALGCLYCSSPKSLVLIPNWGHWKGKGALGDALGWL